MTKLPEVRRAGGIWRPVEESPSGTLRRLASRNCKWPITPLDPRVSWHALSILGLLLLLLQQNALALLIAVAVCATSMPGATVLRRLTMAIPALCGLTTCLLTLTAISGVSVDARLMFAGYILVFSALREVAAKPQSQGVALLGDLCSAASALLVFAVLYRPFYGRSAGHTMALLSGTTDAGTHLALIRAVMREGSYVTLTPGMGERLLAGSQGYPPGLSGSLGMPLQLLLGPEPSIPVFVRAAVPFLVGTFALLAWLTTSLALRTVEATDGRLNVTAALTTTLVVTVSLTAGYAVLLFRGASYAQILATALVLACVVLVLDRVDSRLFVTVLLCLMTVGAVQSWYLLTPVLVLPWLVHVTSSQTLRKTRLGLLAAAVALSAFPIVNGPDATQQVNMTGYVALPTVAGFLLVLLMSAWSVWFLIMKCAGARLERRLLVSLLVAFLTMAIGVAVLQVVTGGGIDYYSAKLFYSALVLATVTVSTAAGILVKQRGQLSGRAIAKTRLLTSSVIALSVAGAASGMITGPSLVIPLLAGKVAPGADGKLMQAVVVAHPGGFDNDSDVWIANGCRRGVDHISTKWFYDLSLTWTADREQTFVEFVARDPDELTSLVRRADNPQVRQIEVYVRQPCKASALEQIASLSKVRIVNIP